MSWERALVTGASSGIGEAIARRLAERGSALVLVARSEERLGRLAELLRGAHGIDVEVLAADLARRDDLRIVEQRLAGDPAIDLCVNNAGLGSSGRFGDVDVETQQQLVDVNITALMRLTHAAIGAMTPRGRGAIINVSSIASYQAAPGSAVYAASKHFVTAFSDAVHEELAGTGVTLTVSLPGFTHSRFHERSGSEGAVSAIPRPLWLQADEVAVAALDAARDGKASSLPGAAYRAVAAVSTVLPRSLTRSLLGAVERRRATST